MFRTSPRPATRPVGPPRCSPAWSHVQNQPSSRHAPSRATTLLASVEPCSEPALVPPRALSGHHAARHAKSLRTHRASLRVPWFAASFGRNGEVISASVVTLTIHFSSQAFSRLQRQAKAAGTSSAELVAASLERPCKTNRPALTDVETASARQRFERHFGELDLVRRPRAEILEFNGPRRPWRDAIAVVASLSEKSRKSRDEADCFRSLIKGRIESCGPRTSPAPKL